MQNDVCPEPRSGRNLIARRRRIYWLNSMRFQVIFISKSIQIVDRIFDLSNWRARTSDECISVAIEFNFDWLPLPTIADKFTGMAQMQLTRILFDHLEPRLAAVECILKVCDPISPSEMEREKEGCVQGAHFSISANLAIEIKWAWVWFSRI